VNNKRRKAKSFVCTLHRNCLLKHVFVGRIRIQVTGRRRRRRKQLLDGIKDQE